MPAVPSPASRPADEGASEEPDHGALADALEAVGDRWTLRIVATLLDGPRRFADLQRELPGLAPNVLSGRLQRLTEDGLVLARPYSERPQRFSYELTARGRGLAGPIRLLIGWATTAEAGEGRPTHAACGAPLEATWFCPACRQPVADDEVGELDYA